MDKQVKVRKKVEVKNIEPDLKKMIESIKADYIRRMRSVEYDFLKKIDQLTAHLK